MREIVVRTARLYAAHLPALLAFFLAGWVVNYLLLRLAGALANIDPVYGYLVLPLAVLARIASYVGMFLVLRPGRSFLEALGTSILPFLVVFATWGMLKSDWVGFSLAQLETRRFDGTDPELFFGVTPITVGIVVVAFSLRLLIKKFSARLPRWFGVVAAYLEAVWIFIAIDIIAEVTGWVVDWLDDRVIVVWWNGLMTSIGEAVAPLAWITEAVAWLLGQAAVLIGQPLAWLTVAGIVYAMTTPHATPTRWGAAARKRMESLPGFVSARLGDVGNDLAGRWLPIAQSARLIWRSGVITMALFVLAYAILDTSSEWLAIGIHRLLGPHELGFWNGASTTIGLVIDTIVEPLRISLVAATWAFCLTLSDAGRDELQREQKETREDVRVEQA